MRLARGSVLEPLANGDFVRLWLANGLWWQAMWMEMLALGWVALELTDSAWWVQVIAFYRAVPLLIVGLFGAVITDRFRRRRIVATLQLINLLGMGLLALLLFRGELEIWHLSAVSLVLGAVWALDWPTRRSMVPDLVGKARTVDAMVLENVIQGVTRVGGPLAAGYVTAAYGSLGALLVLVGLGALGLLLLAGPQDGLQGPRQGFVDVGVGRPPGMGQSEGVGPDLRRLSRHGPDEHLDLPLHEPAARLRPRRVRPRPAGDGLAGRRQRGRDDRRPRRRPARPQEPRATSGSSWAGPCSRAWESPPSPSAAPSASPW